MSSISAVIIAFNEASKIRSCIRSVSFCNEIIVVDSGSSDDTVAIAKEMGAQIHFRKWSNYCEQRNFATQIAKSEWVLSIDADETVTDELRVELEKLIATNTPYFAFSLPRKTFHFSRWIRYGGWYPNRIVRFFRPSEGLWKGDELHEYWHSNGPTGKLLGHLNHYSFDSFADQIERNNRYSSLGAEKLLRSKRRFSFWSLASKTISKFVETYFIKLGFLDGYPGFFISVSAAYSVFSKWAKLWELESGPKEVE